MNGLTVARVIGVALLLSACNRQISSPVVPTPVGAPPPTATFTLSGAVSEMTAAGPVPIRGARVSEVSSSRSTLTDASGFYRITGLSAASHSISFILDGYATQTTTVTMSGDTQLEVRLERTKSYTLSGVVFEMGAAGPVPVDGVEIYCDSCGSPDGHTFVYTDGNGVYSLSWTRNGRHPLFVRKAGYDIFDPSGTLRDREGRITATVDGDTRLDVQLVRR